MIKKNSMLNDSSSKKARFKFPKSPTGIQGLDDITTGGLPKNRPTLLLGNTGCGKTIMAMEFIVNGIVMYHEPGVFMAFEEKEDELIMNVKALGYNLDKHLSEKKIYLEHVHVKRDEILDTGRYDIEGLFVRLAQAIDKVKAKRVVLDSLDTLFYGFDYKILRSEFKRLFAWLKE
jgi:circadian clock protein KaiC